MTASVPFRDTFWNVPGWAQVALYVGAIVAVTVFVYGLAQRVRVWNGGRPEPRFDRIPERVTLVAKHALGQARTLSQAYPGVMHAIMFWGFLALGGGFFVLNGLGMVLTDFYLALALFHLGVGVTAVLCGRRARWLGAAALGLALLLGALT